MKTAAAFSEEFDGDGDGVYLVAEGTKRNAIGRTHTAIFRPSNSTWYINRSTSGTLIRQFGTTGDAPLPSSFVQ